MALEASDSNVATAAPEPTPVLTVLPTQIAGQGRRQKSKVPARRVYGDDFVVEVPADTGPGGPQLMEVYYPNAGEWIEFLGSMTIETYMKTLDLQRLRRREVELRGLVETIREGTRADMNDRDRAAVQAAEAEMTAIADEVKVAMAFTHRSIASLIKEGCWTNSRDEPLGTPTGRIDPESGLPICTFSEDDLRALELNDLGWLSDHAYGDMRGGERGKD